MEPKRVITTHKIEDLVAKTDIDRVSVTDLVSAMEGAGFGLALMIFAFGIIIPLPPPFPSIIALPLVVFSLQMILAMKAPKLPARFSKLTVKRSVLAMLVSKSSPYISKVESLLKQRLLFMTSPFFERIIGFFSFLFSSFIVIPMPLSNFIPGLGILIISFGLISRDGLVVILGIIVGLIGIAISLLTFILGFEALNYLKNLIF